MSATPAPVHLEEVSLNAWPAIQTTLYDGWLLRLANGYTRRANSVTALYPGTLAVEDKVRACERFYREQGQTPVFRLTPFAQPPELDAYLAGQGYRRRDTTSVQAVDLASFYGAGSKRAYMLPDRSGVEMWLGSFHRMNPQRADLKTHRQLLSLIVGTLCPMVLMVDGQEVACGLGVLTGEFFGLFDVVTDPYHRRLGYGMELARSLLDWGQAMRARTAYLQVMADNAAALPLYARLGFEEVYRYWYRVPGNA